MHQLKSPSFADTTPLRSQPVDRAAPHTSAANTVGGQPRRSVAPGRKLGIVASQHDGRAALPQRDVLSVALLNSNASEPGGRLLRVL
jgi:hypothetical protein